MASRELASKIVRFGVFEVDLVNLELRKQGLRLHLQKQPFHILVALLERPGELIPREDVIRRLWPDGTVVDFDRGLNSAVTRLRQALSDSADTPRYVETVARRGYRFIAPIQTTAAAEPTPPVEAEPPREQIRGRLWVLPGLIAALLLPAAWWSQNRSRVNSSEDKLNVLPLTTEVGVEQNPSFSPDGNQVTFEWDKGDGTSHIYVKAVGSGDPVQLTAGPSAEFGPAWSPDGRRIAFLRKLSETTMGVFVTSALGGVERKVAETAQPDYVTLQNKVRRLDWTRDSSHLIVSGPDHVGGAEGLLVISVETGEKRWLTEPSGPSGQGDREPAVSPDGQMVAFVRGVINASEAIHVLPLSNDLRAAGEPRHLSSAGNARSPAWSPDGHKLIFTNLNVSRSVGGGLWTIGLDNGAPTRILANGTIISVPAISRTGRLSYSQLTVDWNIWRQELPSSPGIPLPPPVNLIASTAIDANPQYSPDGTRIAFASSRSGSLEIWACDSFGAHCVALTAFNGQFATGTPRWSPDNKWIAFDSAAAGKYDVYVVDRDGGVPRRITNDSHSSAIPSWSRDGKFIYFQSVKTGNSEIWKMPSGSGAPVQVTRNGGSVAFESADGEALYFTKTNGELWRSALDGSGETAVLKRVASRSFAVALDRIYYLRNEPDGKTAIRRFLLASGEDSPITSISKPTRLGLSLSPDGRFLVYTQADAQGSDLMLVESFHE